MARLHPLLPIVAATALWFLAEAAAASPFVFTYGGRLANSSDLAVTGPVNLELKFYRTASGGNSVGVSTMVFSGVPLEDGVFQVDVTQLTPAEMALVFDPSQDTYVEITDRTNNVTYPRQHLSAMPYAMKVPVDAKTVIFDGNGNLTLAAGQPSPNQFLTKDSNGNLIWGSPASTSLGGQTVSSSTPSNGQILSFNSGQWVATNPGGGGTVTSVTAAAAPLTVTSSTTAPVISIAQASGTSAGYLAASDYSAFNNMLSKSGGTMTGGLQLPSNGLVVGSGQLTLSGNNVGIGSLSPGTLLDVAGDAHFERAGGSQLTIQSPSSDVRLSATTNSGAAQQLLINPYGGSVGIGTTAPLRPLDIAASINHSPSGSAAQLSVRGPTSTAYKLNIGYDTSANYGYLEAVNEGVGFKNLALQPSGGNVGIATTSPVELLDIYNGHFVSRSPSSVSTASCGTGGSASGSDNSFKFAPGSSTQTCLINFSSTWSVAPNSCTITAANLAAAGAPVYVSSITTSNVTIATTSTYFPSSSSYFVQCF